MGKVTLGKSGKKSRQNVLVGFSSARIRRFLVDSANLPNPIDFPDHRRDFERWLGNWQRFFTFRVEFEFQSKSKNGLVRTNSGWKSVPVPHESLALLAPVVRTTLNRLWVEQDARQRDWYIYRLRDAHRQMVRHLERWDENTIWGRSDAVRRFTDYVLQELPEPSFFEAAMGWLQAHQSYLRVCPSERCNARHFLRTGKRHVYCNECANVARREAKLRWWHKSPNSPKNRTKN